MQSAVFHSGPYQNLTHFEIAGMACLIIPLVGLEIWLFIDLIKRHKERLEYLSGKTKDDQQDNNQ